MILDLILWFMCELIEIFATVKIYKKITNKVKETLKNKTVTVEKVTKKKFIRKKVIEAPYTEYIFK